MGGVGSDGGGDADAAFDGKHDAEASRATYSSAAAPAAPAGAAALHPSCGSPPAAVQAVAAISALEGVPEERRLPRHHAALVPQQSPPEYSPDSQPRVGVTRMVGLPGFSIASSAPPTSQL